MHISKEDTGKLTATVKLTIGREDYEEKVMKTLKDYQRKASIPGFRPGKVPFGMISKMYRKGLVLDELNHLMAEKLQNYIAENELRLIGNPLPNKEKAPEIDLETQTEFDFYFDLGFAPEIDLDLKNNIAVDYYKITATEKMIDDQINDICHRAVHHDHEHNDEAEGEEHQHEHEELPELNEEFFNKVFPGAEIKDEAAFRAKIKDSIEHSLARESERFFMNAAVETLVGKVDFDLPEEFLKKLIRENDESQLTEEQIEAQYDNFVKSVRWQLIETKLIRDHELHIKESEMRDVVRGYFTGHMVNAEVNEEQEERLNKIVDSVLSNKEESNRLHDQLYDQKLLGFFKSNLEIVNKEVDYDEFIKMITQKKV